MACNTTCSTTCNTTCVTRPNNCGYIIIIVLYILLAIILGSCLCY